MMLNSPSHIHSLLDPARFMRYGTGPGGSSGAAPNSAAAQAYFDRLVPYPTSAREAIYGAFVDALVTAGLDSVFDFLYVNCVENGANALTDVWRTDRQGQEYLLTSGLTFTADSGWSGGTAGNHITSRFDPTTATSPRFARNDAMITCYIGSTATVSQPGIFHATDAAPQTHLTNVVLWPKFGANGSACVNGAEFSFANSGDSSGLYVVQRTTSTLTTVWKNGVSLATDAGASAAIQAGVIRFCSGAQTFRIQGAGKSMTTPQLAAWQTAVETLITAIRGSLP